MVGASGSRIRNQKGRKDGKAGMEDRDEEIRARMKELIAKGAVGKEDWKEIRGKMKNILHMLDAAPVVEGLLAATEPKLVCSVADEAEVRPPDDEELPDCGIVVALESGETREMAAYIAVELSSSDEPNAMEIAQEVSKLPSQVEVAESQIEGEAMLQGEMNGPETPVINGVFNFSPTPTKCKAKSRTSSERDELEILKGNFSLRRLSSNPSSSSLSSANGVKWNQKTNGETIRFGSFFANASGGPSNFVDFHYGERCKSKGALDNSSQQNCPSHACDNAKEGLDYSKRVLYDKHNTIGPSSTTDFAQLSNNHRRPPQAWRKPEHLRVESSMWVENDNKMLPLKLDASAIKSNKDKLECGLVGRIVGKKLPLAVLRNELQKKWAQFGIFQVISISAECFVCIFSSQEVRDLVLMGGPWHVLGCIMGIDKWTPNFSPHSLKGLTAPVWIRLPSLPLLYWDMTNIIRIASRVGQPLWIDSQTCEWGNSNYARVCVKLKLDEKLPPGVWIQGDNELFHQKVEYEGIPQLCFGCGFVGHVAAQCPSKSAANSPREETSTLHKKDTQLPSAVDVRTDGTLVGVNGEGSVRAESQVAGIPSSSETNSRKYNVEPKEYAPDEYGPWTLVTRRGRKQSGARKAEQDPSKLRKNHAASGAIKSQGRVSHPVPQSRTSSMLLEHPFNSPSPEGGCLHPTRSSKISRRLFHLRRGRSRITPEGILE